MEFASVVGRGLPMVAGAFAIFCWLLWKRQKAEYLAVGGALLSLGLNPVLKLLVERPRPTEDLVMVWREQSGLSFPSGHAFTAILLFGLLYYLVPTFLRWQRAITLVRILSLTMIILIGISRVYLGAHWPSDVLGGFLFGGIMLALVIHLHQQHTPQEELNQAG
jgi:undecaprenyl-diphosphatase